MVDVPAGIVALVALSTTAYMVKSKTTRKTNMSKELSERARGQLERQAEREQSCFRRSLKRDS